MQFNYLLLAAVAATGTIASTAITKSISVTIEYYTAKDGSQDAYTCTSSAKTARQDVTSNAARQDCKKAKGLTYHCPSTRAVSNFVGGLENSASTFTCQSIGGS